MRPTMPNNTSTTTVPGTINDTGRTVTTAPERNLTPAVSDSRSPEETGTYVCPACGEREAFVGTDHRGANGRDACDCDGDGPEENGGHTRDCAVFADVVLTQTFRVIEQDGTPEGAALDYDAHEGGESGAEIGRYTRITCGRCSAVLWQDPTLTAAELAAEDEGA